MVAASPSGARALEQGGPTADDPQFVLAGKFPAVAKVRVIKDGEVLRVGDLAVTAHFTPGHTPGATSWSWRSCEGSSCKAIVYADSLNAVSAAGFRFSGDQKHPGIVEEFGVASRSGGAPRDVLVTVDPAFAEGQTCRTYAAAPKRLTNASLRSEMSRGGVGRRRGAPHGQPRAAASAPDLVVSPYPPTIPWLRLQAEFRLRGSWIVTQGTRAAPIALAP